MKGLGFIARVRALFYELFCEQEVKADRITLTLIEETSSGPRWDVMVEGNKNFSLFSDELVLNFGSKRPMIRFTREGMVTVCPLCSGEVKYGFEGKVPNWWCEVCGHHRISSVQVQ